MSVGPDPRLKGVTACVFDAYGTLFDLASPAEFVRDQLGEKADMLIQVWRRKQLEYTWLRSVMGEQYHEDFWHVTGEALDYALAALDLDRPDLRAALMQGYLTIQPFPEVPETLRRLKSQGMPLAILSNGSPSMLTAAVNNAALRPLFDQILSVEEVGVFKPHTSVYQLVPTHMNVEPNSVCFLSSNGWDAQGAAAFGFRVVWINRYNQPRERLPGELVTTIETLDALPPLLGK